MSGLHVHAHGGEEAAVITAIKQRLQEALPEAVVDARGAGGHFEIRVVSEAFVGKNSLAKQRMVLNAVKDLMKGEQAPVHAIDRIEALTPDQDDRSA